MLSRIAIFTSILFITHASHAMEKEIVKEQLEPNPTFKKYLLIHRTDTNDGILKEVTEINDLIMHNYIEVEKQCLLKLLKDTDQVKYENENRTINAWDDVHIPINYHLILSPIHIRLLNNILLNPPNIKRHYTSPYYHSLDKHYFLESKEEYTIFLMLPIEIRKYLAQPPKSLIRKTKELLDTADAFGLRHKCITTPTQVNEKQVIQVQCPAIKGQPPKQHNRGVPVNFIGYEEYPIVPEEKQLSRK